MRVPSLLFASSVILLAGCSIAPIASKNPSPAPTPTPTPASVVTIKGVLHGGENPIVGAKIYMYAVTLGAYGQASTSLMQGGDDAQQDTNGTWYVPTDANGNFSISAEDYYCTAAGETAVYLYSSGGTPKGLADNPNAGLMAVLGPCTAPSVGTLTGGGFPSVTGFVIMNEVTTVAAAYSLAGFATDPTHISGGSTSQGATAVGNAANNAFNLASLTTFVGQTPALSQTPGNPNSVVPQAEIDTLADALAACVMEASGACSTLQADTTNNPTNFDTAAAAIYIAQHPGNHPSEIFCLVGTGSAPFQPILSGPGFTNCPGAGPNDWTIAITYSNNGLNEVAFLAIDGPGNVWVSNNGNNTISEWNPVGNATFNSPAASGGLSGPKGIAVDTTSSFVWVIDSGGLSEFSTADGSAISPSTGFTEGLFNAPVYLAIDGNNDLWTANNLGNTINEFDTMGTSVFTPTQSGLGGLDGPLGVAIDTLGNVWVANNGSDMNAGAGISVSEFPVADGNTPNSPITGGGLDGPQGIAVDHAGYVWVANSASFAGTSMTEIVPGTVSPPTSPTATEITGGGVNAPYGIAVDGLGDIWATNDPSTGNSTLSEFSLIAGIPTAVSPATGYTGTAATTPFGPVLTNPVAIAIDASGNVWVIDANFGPGTPDNLVEFVGAAAPVVTPLALGVQNGTLGTRP